MPASRVETVGLLLLDKPVGPTSHDCVQQLRRAYRERRVGHTGTLDPFATGLLLICMGRATRLARFFSELPKTYEARIRFGFATDTYDATGKATTDRVPVSWSESLLRETLAAFEGRQLQTPPPFSAKKIGGQRAHRLARAGKAATPDPVWVDVSSIRLVEWSGEEAVVEVKVSSGTYIRSLAHDIGKRLETGAHLSALRRTEIGGFSVEDAVSFDTFLASRGADRETARLPSPMPPERAMAGWPGISLNEEQCRFLIHGRELESEALAPPAVAEPSGAGQERLQAGAWVRLDGPGGQLVALARWPGKGRPLHAELVWASIDALEETATRS